MAVAVIAFLIIGWVALGVSVMVALAFRYNWKSSERNYAEFRLTVAALLQKQSVTGITTEQVQHLASLISGAINEKAKAPWVN